MHGVLHSPSFNCYHHSTYIVDSGHSANEREIGTKAKPSQFWALARNKPLHNKLTTWAEILAILQNHFQVPE